MKYIGQKQNSSNIYSRFTGCLLSVLIVASACTLSNGQTITTFAGTGAIGFFGDGGQATAAKFHFPMTARTDKAGNLYIVDYGNKRIRKIAPNGLISEIAGNGSGTHSGDGGPATSAGIGFPESVALDSIGNIYIGENQAMAYYQDTTGYSYPVAQSWVRKINTSGIITTIAGTGLFHPFSGAGGPATAATFQSVNDVVPDNQGNLYIADGNAMAVWKVNASGILTLFAGWNIYGNSGDGGPATAASFEFPSALLSDGNGNLLIADVSANTIRKVNSLGIVSTLCGNGTPGYFGDGGPATAGEVSGPQGLAMDKNGNIFIADNGNNVIRVITASGAINTFAGTGITGNNGDGGPATDADFTAITGVAADSAGNIYVVDYKNENIRIITPYSSAGIISPAGSLANIQLFPNPAADEINIALTGRNKTIIDIKDMEGREIQQLESNNNTVINLSLAGYAPGMYIAHIQTGHEVAVLRFVVRK